MGNSANKGTLSEPVELRTFNDLLAVDGVAQLATISAAVIDGEISDALNSEDGRADCWTFETKDTTYQIYRWCTGGVWVGGVCAKGSKKMCAEISDGQFSATTADKEAKSLAKELQAAFDEQAASWVEDELADTDEEFGDEDSEQEQIDATHSHAESAESDDEVSVGQAETEDEPTVSAPVAAQETEVIRAEPTADVVEEAEAPVKQPKRSTRRKASEAAPKAVEAPKRSTRKKAAAVVVAESDNVSTASAALSAVTSEPLPGDLTKMKVVDLRQELKARQQTSSGLKKDLVARLQDVLKQDIGQVA